MVVDGFVAQLLAIEITQLDALGRALELHHRRGVRDGLHGHALGLADQHLAEARRDVQLRILVEHVARYHAARTIVDERHFLLPIAEHQMPALGQRHAAHGDDAAPRLRAAEPGEDGAIRAAQIRGGLRADAQ